MPIQVHCPACNQAYNLADSQAGKRVRCRSCSEPFFVHHALAITNVPAMPGPGLNPIGPREPDRPGRDIYGQPRRASATIPPWAWVVLGAGAFVLLLGGFALVLFEFGPSKVTPANYARLRHGMSEKEVRGIMGEPTHILDPSAVFRRHPAFGQHPFGGWRGLMPAVRFLVWQSGPNSITVGFTDDRVSVLSGNFAQ